MPKPLILSIVGARPNFMKVAPLYRALSTPDCAALVRHDIVHTGQHYDAAMSDAFFRDLEMPVPAHFLGVGSGSHAEQTARVMLGCEKVFAEAKPALVIVVGDVNSTIAAALTASKMGIPVAHVEAGLRSFDRTMPEELNRIATDAISDYAFVTEQSGVDNLVRENFRADRIHFVGNTMIDSLHFALPKARRATIVQRLGLTPGAYTLATLHRPSNVDDKAQLTMLIEILLETAAHTNVVFPAHPRTLKKLEEFGLLSQIQQTRGFHVIEPQGYVDFLALTMHARLVVTDSGGVQEETTALGVPCLTLRTTTERPVTCERGTNTLVQPERENIRAALIHAFAEPSEQAAVPPLWDGKAAERIAAILLRDLAV
jgi:UDP-N-acetylglucosamine 2-epimerase (non-hydrolysing)